MPQLIEIVRTVLEKYAGRDLPSKPDLRSMLEQINHLSDEELEQAYMDIGGGADVTTIGDSYVDRLPYPVAILLYMTNRQRNDLVRLLFLFETVECYVRWRVVQALSVVHNERNFIIPDSILSGYSTKVLRPSMGIWVGILDHIGKQIQQNEAVWGVDAKGLSREIELLNSITNKRNEIAHGNIMGDVTHAVDNESSTLEDTIKEAEELFQKYADLNIEHFVCRPKQSYTANGTHITQHATDATVRISAKGNDRLDQRDSYYAFSTANQPVLQIPCTFLILDQPLDIPVQHLTHNFATATFISTHGECKSVDGGGELVYSIVDRPDKYETDTLEDLSNFVRLFKTDVVTLSSEPWNGIFDELIDSSAWKKDRKLLKQCRTDNADPTNKHGQLWYFGGNPETGKSTLLFSYLDNLRNGNAYVFPYRFEPTTHPTDQFLISIREAIVHWLRERTEVPTSDATLTGEDLQKDVDDVLEKLMGFLSKNGASRADKTELIIGLDNLECVYDNHAELQPELDRLLQIIDSWGRFTYTQIRTIRGEEQRQERRQIFVLGTAMNESAEIQDIDNYCNADNRISFVYSPQNIERFKSVDSLRNIKAHKSSRERELHLHQSNPAGAHMPPLDKYGAIEIMTERSRNAGFGAFVKDPNGVGHTFIDASLNIGNRNPIVINAIAENLTNGIISIHDPITQDSYGALNTSGSPYLQNHAVLIPMILCFMHDLQTPLTVSSLQILCSIRSHSVSAENKYISDVLYNIPQYVEKIALSEANPDGSLAFGWKLRRQLSSQDLSNLSFVMSLVHLRIQQLINAANILPDSLQLKSVFIKRGSIQAPNAVTNLVAALANDLRGALAKDIQSVLTKNSTVQELQRSADMLYQTAAISPASITWLQKASESHTYQTEVDSYIKEPAFDDFWLKHINVEPTPLFDHEIQVVGYPEKLEKTITINDEYYIAIGGSYNSVAVYNKERSQPDSVVLTFDSPQSAADCVVVQESEETYCVAVAIGQTVDLYTITITDRARKTAHSTHSYGDDIKGLLVLQNNELAVFGNRKDTTDSGDKWAIDILHNLASPTITCTTLHVDGPVTTTNKPKFGFHVDSTVWITYGKTAVTIDPNTVSQRYNTGFVSKVLPLVFRNGFLCQKGTNPSTQNSWFNTNITQAQELFDSNGNNQFNKIIFAEAISEDRLLTVDYRSVVRIYEWGQQTPSCELTCHASNADDVDIRDITGALRKDSSLLLYGKRGFMAFYDIGGCIASTAGCSLVLKPYHSSKLHYGGVLGSKEIPLNLQDHDDLFITWSEDNDLRLWSWGTGKSSNPDCIGLFRGHEDKVKDVQLSGHTIISIDTKNNIRTWQLNNGCIKQLSNQRLTSDPLNNSTPPISLERCPNFINKGFLFNDTLWSVTSAEGNLSMEEYQNHGMNWSQRHAVYNQSVQIPTGSDSDSGLRKSINLGQYILLLFQDKTTAIWDTIAKKSVIKKDLHALSVSNWQLHSAGLLLWDKETIYRLDTQLTLTTLITTNDLEVITTARCDSSGISYATRQWEIYIPARGKNKGTETPRAANICHIYKADSNGSGSQRIDSRTFGGKGADISGIYHNNNLLLYWIHRANQPLELYWYNSTEPHIGPFPHSTRVDGNRLLKHAPHSIYRLPKEEGFSFKSGDNDRRWVLTFDFPLIEEDTVPPVQKKLLLELHTDWKYATVHLADMLTEFENKTSALDTIYAEASPFGVVLHYHTAKRNGRLLWTGTSIRDFTVVAVTPEGLILLKKNRNIIVLQLMKGDEAKPFSALTAIDD